jgi:Cu/Ag efflux protein CusF
VTVLSIQASSHNSNGGHRDGASGAIASIDTVANTITLQGREGASATFNVTSTTTVTLDGAPSTFSALVAGDFTGLKLAADGVTVVSISAESHSSGDQQHDTSGPVASVDTVANTITLQRDGGATATFIVTSTTTVTLDGASSTLAAIVAGDSAELKLAADGVTVLSIQAESQSPQQHETSGPVASVDTVANTITLQRDGGATATYNVTSTTTVTLDGAPSTFSALVAGDSVDLKLAADGVTVLSIQAESQNPQQHDASGPVVSVDTVANTITLHHGDGDATATYHLTNSTTIMLDSAPSTLSALAAGDSADLKLAADGITVVSIQAETQH